MLQAEAMGASDQRHDSRDSSTGGMPAGLGDP